MYCIVNPPAESAPIASASHARIFMAFGVGPNRQPPRNLAPVASLGAGDRTTRPGLIGEVPTPLGPVLVDAAGRRGVIEHGAVFYRVLQEDDVSAPVGGFPELQVDAEHGGVCPEHRHLARSQMQAERAATALGAALLPADPTGGLGSQPGCEVHRPPSWARGVGVLPAGDLLVFSLTAFCDVARSHGSLSRPAAIVTVKRLTVTQIT